MSVERGLQGLGIDAALGVTSIYVRTGRTAPQAAKRQAGRPAERSRWHPFWESSENTTVMMKGYGDLRAEKHTGPDSVAGLHFTL